MDVAKLQYEAEWLMHNMGYLLDQAAHLKPQIRKDITITKYKMVKQEQGSLVFNL